MNGPNVPSSFPSALHLFACLHVACFLFLFSFCIIHKSSFHQSIACSSSCLYLRIASALVMQICVCACAIPSSSVACCSLLVAWFDPQAVVSLMWSSPIPKGNSQFRLVVIHLLGEGSESAASSGNTREVCQFPQIRLPHNAVVLEKEALLRDFYCNGLLHDDKMKQAEKAISTRFTIFEVGMNGKAGRFGDWEDSPSSSASSTTACHGMM